MNAYHPWRTLEDLEESAGIPQYERGRGLYSVVSLKQRASLNLILSENAPYRPTTTRYLGKDTTRSYRLPVSLIEDVQRKAKAKGTNANAVVRRLLIEWMAGDHDEDEE